MMITLWLLACGPGPRTWPSIDEGALQERLDLPTAPQPDPEAVVEELADILRAGGDLESIPTALASVLAEPGTEAPEETTGDVVAGTSAFFEVACPGTSGVPDPDFALGRIRVEGPFLLEDGSLPVLGPLFLELDACELGATLVGGELRARWLPDDERLLAIGDLELLLGDTVLPFEAAFAVDPTGFALSYPITRGTITLEFGAELVQVVYADGGYQCTRADPVDCGAVP